MSAGNTDMTYCAANCLTASCERNAQRAPREGPHTVRVSWTDFSPECSRYEPMHDKPDGEHPQ